MEVGCGGGRCHGVMDRWDGGGAADLDLALVVVVSAGRGAEQDVVDLLVGGPLLTGAWLCTVLPELFVLRGGPVSKVVLFEREGAAGRGTRTWSPR